MALLRSVKSHRSSAHPFCWVRVPFVVSDDACVEPSDEELSCIATLLLTMRPEESSPSLWNQYARTTSLQGMRSHSAHETLQGVK